MKLIKEAWYDVLIEDCKDIVTEAIFTSHWALVEGYHMLGERIRTETKFTTRLLQDLAVKINVSERTLWYALKLYDKYPNLNKVPEGKKITWNKLITQYLPDKDGKDPQECQHSPITVCKFCRKVLDVV